MKNPSLSTLKKKAWKVFSEHIRKKYADEDGIVRCVSCGKSDHWKELHAGHYIPKSLGLSVYFEEKNVHPQCLTKESKIKMFNGLHKSISAVKKGEFIWAFNEKTFSLEKAMIENIMKFIPDLLYEVELEDGKKFYATEDHLVVSNGEWASIKYILHDVSAHDIMEI